MGKRGVLLFLCLAGEGCALNWQRASSAAASSGRGVRMSTWRMGGAGVEEGGWVDSSQR